MRFFNFVHKEELIYGAIVALGIFLGHANPIVHLAFLVLMTPYALAVFARKTASIASACKFGFIASWIGYSLALYWIYVPTHDFGGLPVILACLCPILLAIYPATFLAVFASLASYFKNSNPFVYTLTMGCAWYLLEWASSFLFTGFPWLPLSSAFAEIPAMTFFACVFGTFALSGIYTAIVMPCLYKTKGVVTSIVALTLFIILGWHFNDDMVNFKSIQQEPYLVITIQGNVEQNVKWTKGYKDATLDKYMSLTVQELNCIKDLNKITKEQKILVIWPETAIPSNLPNDPMMIVNLRTFCAKYGIHLLTGALGYDKASNAYLNAAYLVPPEAKEIQIYEKSHLVPFGEYIPYFFDFQFLRNIAQIGAFTKGNHTKPLIVNKGSDKHEQLAIGVLICYESIFPDLARDSVESNAGMLVEISNNAWFGRTSALNQHLHSATMRAIEQGRPLLRVTNTGITAYIDRFGNIAKTYPRFCESAGHQWIVPSRRQTIYYMFAPYLPYISIIWMAMVFAMSRQKNRRQNIKSST